VLSLNVAKSCNSSSNLLNVAYFHQLARRERIKRVVRRLGTRGKGEEGESGCAYG